MATRTNNPPKPHLGFGTRVRKSPYFESTLKWGCKEYTTYNHMYFPVYYNTPEEDYWSLINDVTLWDVAVERQVEITDRMPQNLRNYLRHVIYPTVL